MKPLTKLEAILSFVNFSLLENTYPIDFHKRGPRGYFKKQLLSVLLAMQIEQIVTIKALIQKLKTELKFKRSCGFDYLDNTPSEATLNRFITQLSNTNILELTYRGMICKAKTFGLIDGTTVAIDASKIHFQTGVENLIQTVTLLNGSDGKCMLWLILQAAFP